MVECWTEKSFDFINFWCDHEVSNTAMDSISVYVQINNLYHANIIQMLLFKMRLKFKDSIFSAQEDSI